MGPIEYKIQMKMTGAFAPLHLEVENESSKHSVPPGSETHFRVLVVSAVFADLTRVERQRQIHEILKDELRGGVHALSLRALTPEEWEKTREQFPMKSPACHSKSQS